MSISKERLLALKDAVSHYDQLLGPGCRELFKAIDQLTAENAALRASQGAMEAEARALVERLREVHADERYRGVWALAYIHGQIYTGPTYTKELEALAAALSEEAPKKKGNL